MNTQLYVCMDDCNDIVYVTSYKPEALEFQQTELESYEHKIRIYVGDIDIDEDQLKEVSVE